MGCTMLLYSYGVMGVLLVGIAIGGTTLVASTILSGEQLLVYEGGY